MFWLLSPTRQAPLFYGDLLHIRENYPKIFTMAFMLEWLHGGILFHSHPHWQPPFESKVECLGDPCKFIKPKPTEIKNEFCGFLIHKGNS